MKIVEFAFVVYLATDLARSRAFYEGVRGLTSTTSIELGDGLWPLGHETTEPEVDEAGAIVGRSIDRLLSVSAETRRELQGAAI